MSSLYAIISALRAQSARNGAYRLAEVSDNIKRITGKRGDALREYLRQAEQKREDEVLARLVESRALGTPEPPLIYPPPKPRR
jgi:hypothetical protein